MNTQQLQYNYRTTQQNLANLHFKLLQAKIIKVINPIKWCYHPVLEEGVSVEEIDNDNVLLVETIF